MITVDNYTDTTLSAYVSYSYVVEATNAYGQVQSTAVIFRTLPGAPTGMVIVYISYVKSRSAYFTWNKPVNLNGPLLHYSVKAFSPSDPGGALYWQGQEKYANVTTFVPFTNYSVIVETCTPGGCLDSWTSLFMTKSAIPSGVEDPLVTVISDTELLVEWKPPVESNGKYLVVIISILLNIINGSLKKKKKSFKSTNLDKH